MQKPHRDSKDGRLYFGDGVGSFSTSNDSCDSWHTLNGAHNYTSKSSSLKILYSGDRSDIDDGFAFELREVRAVTSTVHAAGTVCPTLMFFQEYIGRKRNL